MGSTRAAAILAMALSTLLASGSTARAFTPPGTVDGALPDDFRRPRVPAMLLTPLPTKGGIPRMAPKHVRPGTPEQWARFDATFAALKSRNFAHTASSKARESGLATLRESTDPAAIESMYAAFHGQKQDVLLAVLDACTKAGAEGQYALASIAIQDNDAAIRAEATRRLGKPPSAAVLAALDDGLRAEDHEWINRAGILAGAVHAVEALPTLIFAQVAQSAPSDRGDRAWIATGRTISYVANVIPVVGDNAGAYQPVIGQLIEGVVLRVQDCAVTIYHGGVHDSLVAMAAYDSGMDVAALGWDIRAWHRWFNEEYVPFKRRQDEELAKAAAQVP
jgi:hypothetical protein